MTKLTIIGAGSAVFTKNIFTDLMFIDDFKKMDIALVDIDEKRLKISHELLDVIAKKLDATPNIKSYTNRKEALVGSDFVQSTIQVGGYKPSTVIDFDIPNQFGLKQTIADTLGIGGIMRGLRTIPVLVDIGKDIMDLCPNSLWLQYVNPMCSNMIAINNACPGINSIGLCHSVQGTAEMLAEDLNEEINNINYQCAGINHMAFFQKFEKISTGEDLYPKLKKLADLILNDKIVSSRTKKQEYPGRNLHEKVRYEVLKRFGFFVTESSEHFAEYVPWFIKPNKKELIQKYNIPLDEYILRCEYYSELWKNLNKNISMITNENIKRSHEYASYIIDAIVNNNKFTVYGNVMNDNLIENLPNNCCVEVPCLVDEKGFHPKKIGRLPEQLSALMRTNINVQILSAEAALTQKKEHIYHAAMLDPLTSSHLSIDEIYALVDEMLEAHSDYLPEYR